MITVKEVSQKECCPPHSHLHYLSTCQSICLFATQCSEDWQTLFTKEACHTHCAMRKGGALNVGRWSAILLLLNIFHQFLIMTPVAGIKNSKVFYQSCLADTHQADSSITTPLHLSLTLIRNPFQMSRQFLFSRTKHSMNKKKGEDRHRWNSEEQEITCQTVSPHCYFDIKISKLHSAGNNTINPIGLYSFWQFLMNKVIVYLTENNVSCEIWSFSIDEGFEPCNLINCRITATGTNRLNAPN